MKSSHKLKFEICKHIHSIEQPLITIDLKFFMNQMKLRYLKSILQSRLSLLPSYCIKSGATSLSQHRCCWGKQGRIHGCPSRVRVGRGWGHLMIWAGALRPKTAKTQKSNVTVIRTDGRTDGPIHKAGCRDPTKNWQANQIHLMTVVPINLAKRVSLSLFLRFNSRLSPLAPAHWWFRASFVHRRPSSLFGGRF